MAAPSSFKENDLVKAEKRKENKAKKSAKGEKKMEVAPSLPKQKPKPQGNKNQLTDVVKKQNLSGCWEADSSVASKLGKPLNDLLGSKPSDIGQDNVWFTLLVLVWIETCFEDSYSTWQLIHDKGI